MEKPKLTITGGIARRTAVDEDGNDYIEFEKDSFADQENGICAVCDEEMESGWLCLDGGDEYHDECVEIAAGAE